MKNEEAKSLCLALMEADTEDEVINLLKGANVWDDPDLWRYYGDNENNYSTVGNQQSRPDAALVEKCVNSVDARLMNECLSRSIDPESTKAPQSVKQAVAEFFEDNPNSSVAGRIAEWSPAKRTTVARGITIAATGNPPSKGRPCFTISDIGEGQNPDAMPDTLLSLLRNNKLRIPFVQGKFNMGGSGVLKFCGKQGIQLIVSRRNPAIVGHQTKSNLDDDKWGFTVLRREDPAGGRRSSVYTYLAPIGADKAPRHGAVLRFSAHEMPLFPDGGKAYARTSKWGTLIKLYEYSAASGYSSGHILRKDGLLSRLDLLLPDPALPIRLHECRPHYGGHAGSYDTTLTGLSVRLQDDKGANLEDAFPNSCPISVDGEPLMSTVYAFKSGKADTYRKHEGIIFTLNGQTHGHFTTDFFHRKAAGRLGRIADSVLVVVDCSDISGRAREDLFMNSRDRLSATQLRSDIEDKLEEMLRHHELLLAIMEKRRNEEIQSKLEDDKPLEEILKSLLEKSPTLSALFLKGLRAVNPFRTLQVQQQEKEFEGKKHPSFFKFKDKDYGKELQRDCHINQRCRITFETDVVNDYLSRSVDKGEFSLFLVSGGNYIPVSDFVGPNLQDGIATLVVHLPANCEVGDVLTFDAIVNDPTLIEPFHNRFVLQVSPALVALSGTHGERRKPPSTKEGEEREVTAGITLPKIIKVFETEWNKYSPPFDKHTAMRVTIDEVRLPETDGQNGQGGKSQDVYEFKINMDNLFLKTELKSSRDDVDMTKARWVYGLVLIGLALLHDDVQSKKSRPATEEDESEGIETRIESLTQALAPVMLPMINSLGAMELEAALASTASGEAT